jgi:EpsI family protein
VRRLCFALAVLGATAALSTLLAPAPAGALSGATRIPDVIGDFRGREEPLPERALEVLGTRDATLRLFRSGAMEVRLALVVSEGDRQAAHPPEVCLEGAGYEVLCRETVAIDGIEDGAVRLVAARAGEREEVLYFYAVGDRLLGSYLRHQFRTALARLAARPERTALVRLSAPEGPGSTQALAGFARALLPVLARALRGGDVP